MKEREYSSEIENESLHPHPMTHVSTGICLDGEARIFIEAFAGAAT